jgi:2,4-dienoyl-CoA reductase-like NADH-dependent reductase (Old Yellow Enzyme family)
MVARYRAVGLPFEVLGAARRHWGEDRVPVRMNPARAADATWFGAGASGPSRALTALEDQA